MMRSTFALAAVLLPTSTMAAAPPPPVAAPDYSKHFYFHKAGVTLADAKADYIECASYGGNVRNIEPGVQNTYVPYYAPPGVSPLAAGIGGAIGGMIGSMLVEAMFKAPERRGMRRTIMRKCMHFKGYSRYGIDEARYDALTKGDDREVEAQRFAELAAGAQPSDKALTA